MLRIALRARLRASPFAQDDMVGQGGRGGETTGEVEKGSPCGRAPAGQVRGHGNTKIPPPKRVGV